MVIRHLRLLANDIESNPGPFLDRAVSVIQDFLADDDTDEDYLKDTVLKLRNYKLTAEDHLFDDRIHIWRKLHRKIKESTSFDSTFIDNIKAIWRAWEAELTQREARSRPETTHCSTCVCHNLALLLQQDQDTLLQTTYHPQQEAHNPSQLEPAPPVNAPAFILTLPQESSPTATAFNDESVPIFNREGQFTDTFYHYGRSSDKQRFICKFDGQSPCSTNTKGVTRETLVNHGRSKHNIKLDLLKRRAFMKPQQSFLCPVCPNNLSCAKTLKSHLKKYQPDQNATSISLDVYSLDEIPTNIPSDDNSV